MSEKLSDFICWVLSRIGRLRIGYGIDPDKIISPGSNGQRQLARGNCDIERAIAKRQPSEIAPPISATLGLRACALGGVR